MSKDGRLPDNVTEDMIPGNRPCDNHHECCPLHDDAPELCVCGCEMDGHEDPCQMQCGCEGKKLDKSPECACPTIADDIAADKADAAEARRDLDEDR